MPNITLTTYNTLAIAAASGVYRLTTAGQVGARTVDLLNNGPGAIYIRTSVDPATNDPNSMQLPANVAYNGLMIDSAQGLGVIAAADTTISVKLS